MTPRFHSPSARAFLNSNARNNDPQTAPSDTYSVRVDQYLSARDSLWGRYTWSEQDSSAALALKGSRINTVIPAKNLGVGYTRTFGPSTVLTALFGFSSTTFNDAPSFTSRNLIGEGLFKGFANDPRALTPGSMSGYFNLSMRNRKLGPQRGFQEHADLSHNSAATVSNSAAKSCASLDQYGRSPRT